MIAAQKKGSATLTQFSYESVFSECCFWRVYEAKSLHELIPLFQREGRKRNGTNWLSYTPSMSSFATLYKRGYTGHEHIDAFEVINMNGRIYDPRLGRFLSPDPFIQAPGYTQSYNRYSYVWNNPMKFTDPSGYTGISSWSQFLKIVRTLWNSPYGGSWSASNGYTLYTDVQVTPSGGIEIYTGGGSSSSTGGLSITLGSWMSISLNFKIPGLGRIIDPKGFRMLGVMSYNYEVFRTPLRFRSVKVTWKKGSGSDSPVMFASMDPYDWGEPEDANIDVSSVAEAGLMALLGYDNLTLTGNALNKVINSPATVRLDYYLIGRSMADPNYGSVAFSFRYSQVLRYGGERAPGNMTDQFLGFWKSEYRDTWRIAGNELTWLLRHANVSGWVQVNASGDITIQHTLQDRLDLSASPGRSAEYNRASSILGYGWHTILGASAPNINASWITRYP